MLLVPGPSICTIIYSNESGKLAKEGFQTASLLRNHLYAGVIAHSRIVAACLRNPIEKLFAFQI